MVGEKPGRNRGFADDRSLRHHQADGAGFRFVGKFSRTPKIVVVESSPGREATRTATMSSWAHSLVESGQRPDTTKPLRVPREWKGGDLHCSTGSGVHLASRQ